MALRTGRVAIRRLRDEVEGLSVPIVKEVGRKHFLLSVEAFPRRKVRCLTARVERIVREGRG